MWGLLNSTAYAAERTFVRDRNGAEIWVVVVKCTFLVRDDGSTVPADVQEEIHQTAQFHGDPRTSSLRYDSDLLPARPATDVVVLGSAHASGGRPAREVDVSLRVGPIAKVLRVFGDRRWRRGVLGPTLSDPEPFTQMPLVYERAFGGVDPDGAFEPRNPVGVGFATSPSSLVGALGPNIEDPRHLLDSAGDRPPPAGLGPIASHWATRVTRAGTHDERWELERMPLVPEDFDDRYYQCAPDDQQVPGYLKGGEPVELRNLTPDGLMRFDLPRVPLGFATRIAGEARHHHARLHAVILEPDVRRLMMLWHTELPCHHTLLTLEGTRVVEKIPLPLGESSRIKVRLPVMGPRTPQ